MALSLLESFDHWLFFLVNRGMGHDALDKIFGDLSTLGGWTIGLVALAALGADGRRVLGRHLLALIVALAVTVPVLQGLKSAADRGRPGAAFAEQLNEDPDYVRFVGRSDLRRNAMPSGHSALAFFFMHYLALAKPNYRYPAWTLGALVAFSRVYVGVHFPLDCVAGSLMGMLGGWMAWTAYGRWRRRRGGGDAPVEAAPASSGSTVGP